MVYVSRRAWKDVCYMHFTHLAVSLARIATLRSVLILAIKGGVDGLVVEFHRTERRFSRAVSL